MSNNLIILPHELPFVNDKNLIYPFAPLSGATVGIYQHLHLQNQSRVIYNASAMKILGIETSCDETGASIVEDGVQIISNRLASSITIQKKWGGVVPEQAAREQIKCIVPMLQEIMQNQENGGEDILRATRQLAGSREVLKGISSRLRSNNNYQIDAIAVTVGPGLIGSLLVGVETAKTLAYVWNKPIIPVNHLIGHIYGCWLDQKGQISKIPPSLRFEGAGKDQNDRSKIKKLKQRNMPEFPAVVLLVSGGHTELILMEGHGKFELLGTTRDDAAGEAFDKTARLLGLPYPGGPAIAAAAAKLQIINNKLQIYLPRPMIGKDTLDFSFSGLKTAALREVQKQKTLSRNFVSRMACEIQESITDVLINKTMKAVEQFLPKSLLVCGGVAANKRLREKFEEGTKNYFGVKFFFPPIKYCTDNAATIASAAYFNYSPIPWQEINVNPSLEIR